jgi:RimJ/RimL family protein N-acetyltransferase
VFSLHPAVDIQLRVFHPDDANEFFALLERNRACLHPWIDPSAMPETPQAARRFAIECFFNSLENPMDMYFLYNDYVNELDHYFRNESPPLEMGIWVGGCLAGALSMFFQQKDASVAEFGYWLSTDQQGKGIMTRSVRCLMDYAAENFRVNRFVIGCAKENTLSRGVPQRLGYHIHATIPKGEVVSEFVYDRVIYGIRAREWRDWSRLHP